jgi:hypothetical protein
MMMMKTHLTVQHIHDEVKRKMIVGRELREQRWGEQQATDVT